MRRVDLPHLVRSFALEPFPDSPGSLLRFGHDEPTPDQHPPDRRHRRARQLLLREMPTNRVRTGVEAIVGKLFAEPHDLVFHLTSCPSRRPSRSTRPLRQTVNAELGEPSAPL